MALRNISKICWETTHARGQSIPWLGGRAAVGDGYKDQFVHDVRSSSIYTLSLMKEKPKLLERALDFAQIQEAVETAQKCLHTTYPMKQS